MTLHINIIEDVQRCLYEFYKVPEGVHPADHVQAHNWALRELLRKHGRAIDFHCGRPVVPEVQFGEGVLVGVGQSL